MLTWPYYHQYDTKNAFLNPWAVHGQQWWGGGREEERKEGRESMMMVVVTMTFTESFLFPGGCLNIIFHFIFMTTLSGKYFCIQLQMNKLRLKKVNLFTEAFGNGKIDIIQHTLNYFLLKGLWASQVVLVVKNLSVHTGDAGLIAGSGRSPGVGNGNPLQYPCLGNPTDRGAWWATVHGVAESDTTECTRVHTHTYTHGDLYISSI